MITFRTATPADIPLLRNLACTIWPQVFLTIITRDQMEHMIARMYDPDTVREEMEKGVVWKVVEEHSIPIGYLAYSKVSPTECKLHKIYVLPEKHGQGIGKLCLAEAERFAREQGSKILFLNVNRANARALRAYRAYGFREARSIDWEFSPGFILNDYRMELPLGREQGAGGRKQ